MIMDQEFTAKFLPRIIQPKHKQNPSHPLMLQRALSNDILFDLDPTKTLEALNSSHSSISTIVEDVTPSERAFGIRALIACKSIQEWLEELSNWPWPKTAVLTGFEISPDKEKGLSGSHKILDEAAYSKSDFHPNYIGYLSESQISMYESRISQIYNAMEDLRVDEIKRQVLDTHFSSKPRPSSSCSSVSLSKFLPLESYSKINDFTAMITASILQALPKLSKLVNLMEAWRVRICVLRKIPAFFIALRDTEIALKSGWNAIKNMENEKGFGIRSKSLTLSRESFDVIRYILQEKVTILGQRLDLMLNILEGSQDTLPTSWLARMEDIEEDYGEWVVTGERQVRRAEWLMGFEIDSIDKKDESKIGPCQDHTNYQNTSTPDNKNNPLPNYNHLKHDNIRVNNYMTLSNPESITEISGDFSPLLNESPGSDKTVIRPLFQKDKECSLGGHTNFIGDVSFDITPPESPLTRNRSKSFCSHSLKPMEPLLESEQQKMNSSPAKPESFRATKQNKNDQFQRQISTLLETMPSLICLSPQSESKTTVPKTFHTKGARRSLTPHSQIISTSKNHSQSQTSTPLYTLVPANTKVTTRSKNHNNNSEIRVYHLSRSNGEAPIKLFVRLVGENGERVMVRVGGGWADLGEYLKEFASHHGRLTVTDTVKIHDAPTRKGSLNTLRSSSICWDYENSSPHPRPKSVIEQRPKSSLEIPKTRRSTGMSSVEIFERHPRITTSRCPSTPIPATKRTNLETPPSGSSSNGTIASNSVTSDRSSRMSWNEEDFNLGLAGPRSKKVLISDHDQEWIESMKEKVRLASAEKDRRNRERTERAEKSRNRGLSLDGLDKIGGTRRIFRRDGSVA
ncbi:hypothetical protein HI914_00707 [Erysiphe necator]|uniref:Putative gas2 domain-containing protein n=1 Tax=Uncinula necator TaxID=52586 RepID=A0A0B1P492_UNCNE|nr:hypothetical protein HI914_00707 [Erysiphe necator]KHJ32150.1 putative gas2 domain-containing protein [Erysiphe necator]